MFTINNLIPNMTIKNIQIAKNFKLYEFLFDAKAMPKSSHDLMRKEYSKDIEKEIVKLSNCLQIIRDIIKSPIIITCGFRPVEWDKLQGRAGTSQHCFGKAADFHCSNLNNVYALCKRIYPQFGIAINHKANFIHFDTLIQANRNWEYN